MDIEGSCCELLEQTYSVSAVFVTFDAEQQCQRTVLSKLIVGKMAIATNDTSALPPDHLFRGNLVLDIEWQRNFRELLEGATSTSQ